MTFHAEYSLRSPSIFEILNLLFAIPTLEACCAKGLISRKNGQILYLVITDAATVSAIVADKRPIAEEEEVGIGVKDGAASIAAETVYVPSIARW